MRLLVTVYHVNADRTEPGLVIRHRFVQNVDQAHTPSRRVPLLVRLAWHALRTQVLHGLEVIRQRVLAILVTLEETSSHGTRPQPVRDSSLSHPNLRSHPCRLVTMRSLDRAYYRRTMRWVDRTAMATSASTAQIRST